MPTNILLTGQQFCATIPSNATSVVFCNEIAPTGISLTDVSEAQDNSIVAWLDGTAYKVSTQRDGVKAFANPDSSYMFSQKSALKGFDFSYFDTSLSNNMGYMFYKSTGLTSVDVSSFITDNVTNMDYMFGSDDKSYGMKLTSITFGENFNTSNVTSFFAMFRFCMSLPEVDISMFDTSSAKDLSRLFDRCNSLMQVDVSGFDTKTVENMSTMFQRCYALKTLDLSGWDTSNCEDMSYMFCNCTALTELKAENFNTSKVKTMKQMLQQCNSLKSFSVKNWDVSNCEDLSFLFYGCSSFKSVDFDNWDVRNVQTFDHFMAHAWMEEFDVSKWKVTSKCTNMNAMFHTAMVKYLDVSGFDTSNVTTMSQMFENNERVEEIKGLENFNTSKVTSFQDMFNNAFAIRKLNLSSFDTRNILNVFNMFNRVTLDEISVGDNYLLAFPNSTTGYWYDLYGEEYLPSEIPTGKAMSYYASKELANKAFIELNGRKYISLNSLAIFHEKHNAEINAKLDELQLEADAFEEIANDEILALFV